MGSHVKCLQHRTPRGHINILTGEVMSNRRMFRRDLARVLASVLERQADYLTAWERQHG